jgi:hypothetical protein
MDRGDNLVVLWDSTEDVGMPRFQLRLRLRTLMILVAAVAIALSFDATRRWLMAHWERERDREVLEAAFRDILDPKNPENATFLKNGGSLSVAGRVEALAFRRRL